MNAPMEPAKKHGGARPHSGGARPGAGRPRPEPDATDDALRPVVVYLTGTQLGALTRIGAGNVSSAVRQVINESGIVLSPAAGPAAPRPTPGRPPC